MSIEDTVAEYDDESRAARIRQLFDSVASEDLFRAALRCGDKLLPEIG